MTANAEENMSQGSVTTDSAKSPEQTPCLGLDVSCKYVLQAETLRILLVIVQEARKSAERHQSEAA
jgi:hypothetical protein